MRFIRTLAAMMGLLAPSMAFAQQTAINTCGMFGLPCNTGGAAGFVGFLNQYAVTGAQLIFTAMAIAFFFYYSMRLILESEDENTITETKNAYAYAIGGAVTVGLTSFIVDAVGSAARNDLISPEPVEEGLYHIILFLRLMVSIAVSGMIAYQGIRLILLQGQESEIEQQKKRFFHGLIGVAIVLLAEAAVQGFLPNQGGPTSLVREIVGIINFVLTLLGALAILSFIIAGFLMVISTDEGNKDRAKKAVFTTVIALIVVLSTAIIIRFIILL